MLKANDLAKLKASEERFLELEKLMADETIAADQSKYGKLAKEFSVLSDLMAQFHAYQKLQHQSVELQDLLKAKSDPDLKELAESESEKIGMWMLIRFMNL